jgi:SnoaL-like protein
MRYDEVRELFLHHLTYSGGNEAKAHEIYHDDAVLEFPQSGERFRGKANMQGFREQYPAAQVDFEPREIRGSGDVWIGEGRVLYDGANPHHFVWIAELRGGLVQRETLYFAEPFPAPEWRRQWAEEGATWETHGDLPARIRAGELTT